MADVYTPISRTEMLKALTAKFGGVETVRYFLNDALSDLKTIEVGVGDNNPMQAAKAVDSLRENLENIRTVLEHKENKGGVEKEIKNTLK